MKKKFIICALIIMIIVFLVGVIMILTSVAVGENAGLAIIQQRSYLQANYERVVTATTIGFRMAGVVLSIIGGCGVILSGYGVYKEL